jgi:hypothetical protein
MPAHFRMGSFASHKMGKRRRARVCARRLEDLRVEFRRHAVLILQVRLPHINEFSGDIAHEFICNA